MRPPPSLLTPTLDAVVLSTFPVAWFFGFLYYTDVPSLLSVIITIVAASQGRHWTASMVRDVRAFQEEFVKQSRILQLGIISCTFRQTNIIWLLYAYASSQLMHLRFRRAPPGGSKPTRLHDPPALTAGFRSSPIFFVSRNGDLTLAIPFSVDLVRSVLSAPAIIPDILPPFIPYALTLVLFGGFVIWNGGIVLGTYCAVCSPCSSPVYWLD